MAADYSPGPAVFGTETAARPGCSNPGPPRRNDGADGLTTLCNSLEGYSMANDKSITGISDEEAQEFHGIFTQSMTGFIGVAVFAHLLAWLWRPWL
jgi:light-harvesting complex 1 beta chain